MKILKIKSFLPLLYTKIFSCSCKNNTYESKDYILKTDILKTNISNPTNILENEKNYIFLINPLEQTNKNNCGFNSVLTSLFNSIYIQNFIENYNGDNEFVKNLKTLYFQMKTKNNKKQIIKYENLYNTFFLNYLKKNGIIIEKNLFVGEKNNLTDTITLGTLIAHIRNIYENLYYLENTGFSCREIASYCYKKKNKKIDEKNINSDYFRNEIIKSYKEFSINKIIFSELGIYEKYLKNIEKNYKIGTINLQIEDGIHMFNIDIDDKTQSKFDQEYILICENKRVKKYLLDLESNIEQNYEKGNPGNTIFFLDKICEDKNLELELISINLIEIKECYHISTVKKNINNNKWYLCDDLLEINCREFKWNDNIDDNLTIKLIDKYYTPKQFFINVKLKK